MSANVDAMVREGINAYKAGRNDEARALLLKATELDQYNEQAWLWLSGLMDAPGDQRTCLENVLAINPDNERAKQGLSYLTGQTSAGNVSPFSAAAAPPPALPPSAPTSVEWGAPQEASAAPEAWSSPRAPEPTASALDDWVTNLNLPVNDTQNDVSMFSTGTASPFGDFDPDEEDDAFTAGPFGSSPMMADEETDAPQPRRRSPAPAGEDFFTPEPAQPRRNRNVPGRGNGALSPAQTSPVEAPVDTGESEMFGYIPPEIAATRLPGTVESTPMLLRLGVVVLFLLNLGAAIVVMLNILT